MVIILSLFSSQHFYLNDCSLDYSQVDNLSISMRMLSFKKILFIPLKYLFRSDSQSIGLQVSKQKLLLSTPWTLLYIHETKLFILKAAYMTTSLLFNIT